MVWTWSGSTLPFSRLGISPGYLSSLWVRTSSQGVLSRPLGASGFRDYNQRTVQTTTLCGGCDFHKWFVGCGRNVRKCVVSEVAGWEKCGKESRNRVLLGWGLPCVLPLPSRFTKQQRRSSKFIYVEIRKFIYLFIHATRSFTFRGGGGSWRFLFPPLKCGMKIRVKKHGKKDFFFVLLRRKRTWQTQWLDRRLNQGDDFFIHI